MTVFSYSDKLKIFWAKTASKFQGQHAAQFNFCKYEGLCSASETAIQREFSNENLQNFRTTTLENNFWKAASEKKTEKEKDTQWPLQFQVFTFCVAVIHWVMKQCSFSTNFHTAELFDLDYVIHFYIPKKGLGSPVFNIKILVVKYLVVIRQIIKVLPGNLSQVKK